MSFDIMSNIWHFVINHSFVFDSLWPQWTISARILCLWDFPGENTGVGGNFPLQLILPTQGSGVQPTSPMFPALAGGFFYTEPCGKRLWLFYFFLFSKLSTIDLYTFPKQEISFIISPTNWHRVIIKQMYF